MSIKYYTVLGATSLRNTTLYFLKLIIFIFKLFLVTHKEHWFHSLIIQASNTNFLVFYFLIYKIGAIGTGEMAQQVVALAMVEKKE